MNKQLGLGKPIIEGNFSQIHQVVKGPIVRHINGVLWPLIEARPTLEEQAHATAKLKRNNEWAHVGDGMFAWRGWIENLPVFRFWRVSLFWINNLDEFIGEGTNYEMD